MGHIPKIMTVTKKIKIKTVSLINKKKTKCEQLNYTKTWNEFTGITTNKIYKLLHNGGIEDKYSITGVLTKRLRSLFSLNGFVIFL